MLEASPVPTDRAKRAITIVAACLWAWMSPNAAELPPTTGAQASLAAAPIVDLDFLNISGATVPDSSGHANDGAGRQGAVGFETSWTPSTTSDSQGNTAVVFNGAQMQRIAIPNRSGSLDVNQYSILVRFTLDQSVDTDPLHQRYELMEKAGAFWFNVREDTTPKYLLRTGAYFDGTARSLTGTRVIPDKTLTWAIATPSRIKRASPGTLARAPRSSIEYGEFAAPRVKRSIARISTRIFH